METLSIERREKFCRLVALDDLDGAEAAFQAGYGIKTHPTKDSYHTLIASRLLNDEQICMRIHTIRQENSEDDRAYTKSLITRLKSIITFDMAQYYESATITLKNGRKVTDFYAKIPIQNWPKEDRALMLNGFDASGRPRFIDKQWAWEKLLKIYNLDGKVPVDVEDILGLFAGAGLPVGPGVSSPAQTVPGISIDDEIDADLAEDVQ